MAHDASTHGASTHDACNNDGHAHAHVHGDACTRDAGWGGAEPLLAGRNLTIVRGGRALIENVSLAVASREIVTLIGPNGAGKTTLVRALLGLEPLTSGTLSRKPGLKVGYVPQRFEVDRTIPMQVNSFLALGVGASTWDITAALGHVGAPHVLRSQVSELSGGELQRVILARALLRNPDILVLDEPVRGLDHLGEAEMYDLIAGIRDTHGSSVLLVSHDLHVVMAKTDRVICLNRHVCCSGLPEAVAADPAYAQLFGAEAARAFALYTHHHDHTHDASGALVAIPPPRST